MKNKLFTFLATACLLAAGLAAPLANAGAIVVGAAPGGGVDMAARHLARNLGGNYFVVNKPGLDAAPAAREMRGKATDGSELMIALVNDASAAAGKSPPASEYASLTPVAMLGDSQSAAGKSWFGLFAPPGTPASVVSSLNARVRQLMASVPASTNIQYAQDMSAGALAQRLATAIRAQPATPVAPAPIAPLPPVSQAPAGGGSAAASAGKWPPGVEPGNLYVVQFNESGGGWDSYLLLSARTRAEAESILSRAKAEHKRTYSHLNASYRIQFECTGANWGAVVKLYLSNSSYRQGAACGARTPREAILAAALECGKQGEPCDRARLGDQNFVLVVAHSGSKSWVPDPNKLMFEGNSIRFAALAANSQASNSVQEYIDSFGKACGRNYGKPRDSDSCWITSRNAACVFSASRDPGDGLLNQHLCVDKKFTADGVLP